MADQAPDREFDLRSLNQDLNRSKRPLAMTSVALAVVLSAVALLFGVSDVPRWLNGSITGLQFLAFVVAVPVIATLVVVLAWGLRSKRPGAEWAHVSSKSLQLRFPNRRSILLSWSDPKLRFDLHDYSKVQPGVLSIQARYFLDVEGTDSALTPEAYRSIVDQVGAHGLSDQERAVSSWRAPAGVTVHSIRPKSP
jgi:hypothetical protein